QQRIQFQDRRPRFRLASIIAHLRQESARRPRPLGQWACGVYLQPETPAGDASPSCAWLAGPHGGAPRAPHEPSTPDPAQSMAISTDTSIHPGYDRAVIAQYAEDDDDLAAELLTIVTIQLNRDAVPIAEARRDRDWN